MRLYKVKKSKIDSKGRGLYAKQDIKEGTKIIDYIGKIFCNDLWYWIFKICSWDIRKFFWSVIFLFFLQFFF